MQRCSMLDPMFNASPDEEMVLTCPVLYGEQARAMCMGLGGGDLIEGRCIASAWFCFLLEHMWGRVVIS